MDVLEKARKAIQESRDSNKQRFRIVKTDEGINGGATMPQYADEIRRKRLNNEAELQISAHKSRIKELKKKIKDAKVEICELEAKIEQLVESS